MRLEFDKAPEYAKSYVAKVMAEPSDERRSELLYVMMLGMMRICELYFNIAAKAIGEDNVRAEFDVAWAKEMERIEP